MVTARETLEASLLLGVVLAVLAQTSNRRYVAGVWAGVGAAVGASALLGVALILTVGELEGRPKEAAEGIVTALAAGVLTYVLTWMRRHARDLTAGFRAGAESALARSSALALALLVFLTIFREGAETVLYLAAAAGGSSTTDVAAGSGTGLVAAAAAGYALYRGGTRFLDTRRFFQVTTILLLAFAAGLVARATGELQAAGIFPGTITTWDTSAVVSDSGVLGTILHALVGYTSAPSLLQVIFWLAYLAVVAALYSNLPVGRARPLGGTYDAAAYRLLRRPRVTVLPRALTGALLAFLVVVALLRIDFGPFDNNGFLHWGPFRSGEAENSVFNLALWVVWLPLLTIVTLLLGRVWCGNLCPLRLVTDLARSLADRVLGRGAPPSPTLRLAWLLPSTFVLVTFLVKSWPVQQAAAYGALFFLIVVAIAAAVGFLFRRGTWCRYLCPVGGWLARISRLSPVALRPDTSACARCDDKPCVTGTAFAARCPVALNPSRLETSQHCLACWACVANCPPERASLKLVRRFPGEELLAPTAPNLWESVFVASLIGMYMAAGHRSPRLAELPWPLLFFGLVVLATVTYGAICVLAARLGGLGIRRALTTFGYVFLPLEFGTAVIAFGDDALEFLGITQPAAAVLLALGFVWSALLGVSILRNQARTPVRAVAAALPIGVLLVTVLFVWLQWYAAGAVIDIT